MFFWEMFFVVVIVELVGYVSELFFYKVFVCEFGCILGEYWERVR